MPSPKISALAKLRSARLGVATTTELNALGFTNASIRANIDAGRWQRFHPGVYLLHTGPPSWSTRAWAALMYAGPSAILSHESAAYVRKWHNDAPQLIDVTVPYNRRSRPQPGIRTHRSRAYLHIVDAQAVPPRTTAARTVIDLLRSCRDQTEAKAMVLEALRRRQVSPESLWPELAAERRHPWRAITLEATGLAGSGIQSVLEAEYAEIEERHGLPVGRRQHKIISAGRVEYQDVNYDDYALIVELDGRRGHESVRGQLRDMRRDNRNTISGQATLRYGYLEATTVGCQVAVEVADVLRQGGWQGPFIRCPQCT